VILHFNFAFLILYFGFVFPILYFNFAFPILQVLQWPQKLHLTHI
jgi:hypothetical protein